MNSYYRLIKTVEADPEFDTKRATKKLRKYVESNDHAIRLKAEIMVDHFHEQVLALNKIGGQARAMVVNSGIERAIQYYQAVSAYLVERKCPYRAIVAYSGEYDFRGTKVTEGIPQRLTFKGDRGSDRDRSVALPDLRRQIPHWLRSSMIAETGVQARLRRIALWSATERLAETSQP